MFDSDNDIKEGNSPIISKPVKPIKKSVAKNEKVLAYTGPIIFWTVMVIVAIIVLIGIIMFFLTMPGMAMSKLKNLGRSVINSLLSTFGTDESTFVEDEEIYRTLDYLEEMGYDLKGFGFLTDYVKGEESGVKKETDDITGKERINEAYSDFVKRYIISDNYMYIIKNKNLATNWLDALWQNIKNVFGASYSQSSTRGLLAIYEETEVGRADENNLFSNLGAMSVDTDKKILYLQKGGNPKIAYNLEGWTGRYGMPLEFLLAIHVATMMPDLAFDMADTFDTNVNIYLRNAEASLSDNISFDAYMPYIANVKNHWFRNVYYVVDLNEANTVNQDERQNVVSYNYDYERLYGERWTMYETFSDLDTDTSSKYKDYANENFGDFKLYVLSSNGEYATSSTLPDGAYESNGKIKEKIFQDEKYLDYYIFIGSKEEANDENIMVSKKAVVLTTDEDFEDIGWNQIGDNIWSAYLATSNLRSSSDGKTYYKRYNADTAGSITQTGEGQRGETNSKIKKMFLSNTYFRYDGSKNTAEIITALRNKIKQNKLNSDTIAYGALNALHDNSGNEIDLTQEDISYSAEELGLDSNTFNGTYNVKDYSGQVTLNQDSLNAFTILENIHTLDADYIYRDFKELVVELGYFSKEELTNETSKVLGWIIPDVSSLRNYPERYLDKPEVEYGTLIHSKGDVLAKRYMELEQSGNKKDRENLSKSDFNPQTLFPKWWNYMYGTVLTKGITPEDCVEEAQKLWLEISEGNHDSVSRTRFVSNVLISLNTKLENYCSSKCRDEVQTEGYKTNPDGTFQTDKNGNKIPNTRSKSIERADDVAEVCVDRLCGKIITEFNDLQRGDIIAYLSGGDVVALDILGEKLNGSFVRFTGEYDIKKGDLPPQDFDENTFYRESCFGIRLFGNEEFNGYNGNEMVTSPVTGILLEYGTYENEKNSITGEEYRTNTDIKYPPFLSLSSDERTLEENENKDTSKNNIISDKVGYAKILVLDKEHYTYLEQSTSNRWSNKNGGESLLKDNGKFRDELVDSNSSTSDVRDIVRGSSRWSDLDQTIYAYKEYAETYESAGIAGYIIYIDGFVCENPDDNIEDVTTQIPNGEKITIDTYKTINENSLSGKDVAEAQAMQLPNDWRDYELYVTQSEKENRKFEAEIRAKMRAYNSLYINDVYDKDGKVSDIDSFIFIKEGTILGRTMTDKELLESSNFRNGSMGTYEQNREYQTWQKVDGVDKIIGNYLRIMMRDLDGTVVENVEQFFKDSIEKQFDWYELWYYTPMASGPTDTYMCGPESIGTNLAGQMSVALVQETDTQYPYWNSTPDSSIEKYLFKCWLMDDNLCAKLEEFQGFTRDQFWAFAEGGHDNFGSHYGEFYHLQEGTVYLPVAGYTSGTPCLYNGGSVTGEINRNSKVKWKGKIYDSFNEFIEKQGASIKGEAGDNNAEKTIIYVLDENDNVIASGKLLFRVDGASVEGGADNWYGDKVSGTVYTDATGYMLEESFDEYDGQPQRTVDHSVYVGGDEAIASNNLRTSELQEVLSYISDIDREKFIQIQKEAAKETYLDEIIEALPWIIYRPAALQCALITLLVSGSEAYKGWPEEYQFLSDDELLDQIAEDKSKVKSIGQNPATFTPDATKGHAWTVPEIAKKIISGAVKKYEIEDYARYGRIDVLVSAGVDFRN